MAHHLEQQHADHRKYEEHNERHEKDIDHVSERHENATDYSLHQEEGESVWAGRKNRGRKKWDNEGIGVIARPNTDVHECVSMQPNLHKDPGFE